MIVGNEEVTEGCLVSLRDTAGTLVALGRSKRRGISRRGAVALIRRVPYNLSPRQQPLTAGIHALVKTRTHLVQNVTRSEKNCQLARKQPAMSIVHCLKCL